MVEKELIEYTFDELFSAKRLLLVKCHVSNSVAMERLSKYSRDEIIQQLNGRLSPLEWEDYHKKKSSGLKENTRLFHGGFIDISLVPGMHGVLKGYTSTSFQKISAEHYRGDSDKVNLGWVMEILAPKGTKGICANDHENFDNNSYVFEHEYTLGRNQGYTVVSIDYENKVQVVLLDEA